MRINLIIIQLLLLLALHFTLNVCAQNEEGGFKKLNREADQYFIDKNYRLALSLYLQLNNIEKDNPAYNYRIAVCYLNTNTDKEKAIYFLENALANYSIDELPPKFYYNLGKAYHLNHRFDEAMANYQKFLINKDLSNNDIADVKHQLKMCKNGKELLTKPINIKIENIGKTINTNFPEYSPIISADESILIFTSRRTGSKGDLQNIYGQSDPYGEYFEDIFISHKTSGGWSNPVSIGDSINTKGHESSIGLSPDGQQLFIYISDPATDYGDIYVSNLRGNKWSSPVKLDNNINTEYWEGNASITADGNELYFSSNRPDGHGGIDIYKSKKLPNGQWSIAENLGKNINTKYDEDAPFIHPNGKTIYFSSKGHNSMGAYDIFKATYTKDMWSQATNVGYPLNTADNDIYFVLSADGKHGYYSSSKTGGHGEQDIYIITFPNEPIPLTMVRGTIYSGDSQKPIGAKIKVIDKVTNQPIRYVYNPNSKTGKYLMIFPPGKNYDMIIKAPGYLSQMINIYIPNQTYFYELYQEIYLKPIYSLQDTLGQSISVKNVFYDIKGTDKEGDFLSKKQDNDYLLKLIEKIVETTDSIALSALELTLDKNADSIPKPQPKEMEEYTPLLSLIEQVIATTDSTTLKHLDKIIDAEPINKIYFYGPDKEQQLQKIEIDGDTLLVLPPLNTLEEESIETNNVDIKTGILFSTLYFDFNGATLNHKAKQAIKKVIATLNQYSNLGIEITGHADALGSNKYNQTISENRAKTVENYLISNGVKKRRIILKAFGEENPAKSNQTEEGRQANRRAELRLIEKL